MNAEETTFTWTAKDYWRAKQYGGCFSPVFECFGYEFVIQFRLLDTNFILQCLTCRDSKDAQFIASGSAFATKADGSKLELALFRNHDFQIENSIKISKAMFAFRFENEWVFNNQFTFAIKIEPVAQPSSLVVNLFRYLGLGLL